VRVLHGPVNVANQPWSLSRAERRLGISSELVVNYGTWLSLPADRTLGSYTDGSRRAVARRFAFGVTAPFRYDVLHYYFGRSLLTWDDLPRWHKLAFADLKLAHRLGRKVFMTLQGCDARIATESNRRFRHTPCGEGRCSAFATCVASLDSVRQRLIDDILPLCDRVFYLNPELGHYVECGQFMPYANADIRAIEVIPPRIDRIPRIVHAPSDPTIKGSKIIVAALESLRRRFQFELVLVERRTHEEAMALYRDADLAIDQILAGWYGGVAVELMAMGKPVLCAIRDEDLRFVPNAMRADLSIIRIDPDHVAESVARVLESRDQWLEWSRRSRAFVERWHDPDRIAVAMIAAYRDPKSRFDLANASTPA
jgi:glycosyltransferase involved in cell wall biosynthesis